MRFEIAMALNWKKYLDQSANNKSTYRMFSATVAKQMRTTLTPYISNRHCPTRADMSALYFMVKGMNDLPYPVTAPDTVFNNVAVQTGGNLLLLHWFEKTTDRAEWNIQSKNLEKHRKIAYEFNDGKKVCFEMCAVTYENISYLKVINWKVYSDYKRIESLPKIDKDGLDSRLFPYQVEGIRMLNAGFRLLADEQGLGKTAQVLQFIKLKGFNRVLICCPATLKLNWRREIMMWTDATEEDITVASGTIPYEMDTQFAIINYDLLPYWVEALKGTKYDLVVADECHYVQSAKAQRTQAFLQVIENSKDRIFISGTPFTSRPIQMYTALHNIAPHIFRSEKEYGLRFCGPSYQRGQLVFKGASNMDVLHAILMDGICIRRIKEDVLKDLPEKMRVTLPVMTPKEEIVKDREVYGKIVELERKIAHTDGMGSLEYQKQIAFLLKEREIIGWVRDFLESGKKLVVFAIHRITIDDLMTEFKDIAVKIDGSTSQKERDQAVQRFQNDPSVRLFVGNIKAAGVGITLTAASDVLVTEYAWTAGEMLQAEDRVHRIGAKSSVMAYYMVCPNSIDEKLVDIINMKAKVHKHIFDGKEETMLETIRSMGGLTYTPMFAESEESCRVNIQRK